MKNILIVDDSVSMRQMVSFTLSNIGFSVDEAETGEVGLEKAKKCNFDLVISDVNMPGMGGLEMVKKMRQDSNYRFTPILMLTTEASANVKSEGKAAGATGWIVKPFNPEKLIDVVNKVLK